MKGLHLTNGMAATAVAVDVQTVHQIREAERQRVRDECTTSSVRAVGEQVAVRPKPRPNVTRQGLVLPDEGNEPQQQYGVIISIGSEVPVSLGLAEGDEIILGKYIEVQPDVGGHKFCMLPWKAVLGKVERVA